MVIIKKVKTISELDVILPMIEKFHLTQEYCKQFSHASYLQWLTFNASLPTTGIWIAYDESQVLQGITVPVGYAIVTIQTHFDRFEALIHELYSEKGFIPVDMKRKALAEIIAWAKEVTGQEKILLSCYTESLAVVG